MNEQGYLQIHKQKRVNPTPYEPRDKFENIDFN